MSNRTIKALIKANRTGHCIPPALGVYQSEEDWEDEIEDCINWFYLPKKAKYIEGVTVENSRIIVNCSDDMVQMPMYIDLEFEDEIVSGNEYIMSFLIGLKCELDYFNIDSFASNYAHAASCDYATAEKVARQYKKDLIAFIKRVEDQLKNALGNQIDIWTPQVNNPDP